METGSIARAKPAAAKAFQSLGVLVILGLPELARPVTIKSRLGGDQAFSCSLNPSATFAKPIDGASSWEKLGPAQEPNASHRII